MNKHLPIGSKIEHYLQQIRIALRNNDVYRVQFLDFALTLHLQSKENQNVTKYITRTRPNNGVGTSRIT